VKIVHVVPLVLPPDARGVASACVALWGIVSECVNGVIASVHHLMSLNLIRASRMRWDEMADVDAARVTAANDMFCVMVSTGNETNEIARRP
jgi:hypothetical protein